MKDPSTVRWEAARLEQILNLRLPATEADALRAYGAYRALQWVLGRTREPPTRIILTKREVPRRRP